MESTAKTNTAKDLEKIFSEDFRQSNSMVNALLEIIRKCRARWRRAACRDHIAREHGGQNRVDH